MRRAYVLVAGGLVGVIGCAWLGWMGSRPGGFEGGNSSSQPTIVPIAAPVERAPREDPANLAWGPSVVEYANAVAVAHALPLDVAAGQVIVAAVSSPDAAAAAELVRSQHLAGVILMGDVVTDADQVRELAAQVQAAAAEDGRTWQAVVSTDQEGGPVARLQGIIPDLPAFMAAGSIRDKEVVTSTYEASARDMRSLGINVDWAPDADVTIGASDPTIGVRSAGSDPTRVAATVTAAVDGFLAGGVMPAIKHFPGHGSVTTDSHQALPTQNASIAQLETTDLVPFAAAIKAGAPIVMMGHIAVPEWGGGAASVSPGAYAYLRQSLGFTGVAVTDALNMEGIAASYAPGDSEVAALAAGADMLLFPRDPAAARAAIIAAVQSGAVPRERLDEAVARVSTLMGLGGRLAASSDTAGGDTTTANYARTFAAQAATVSAASCKGPYVGTSVTIKGGWPSEQKALADALAGYGITTGGGTTIRLLGSPTGSGGADVVVAMDGPWGLPQSTASVYVGLYGRSDDALAGLADVLAGAVAPTGEWAVAGMPPACGG